MKYFVFNKASDYKRGRMENLNFDGRLRLDHEKTGEPGCFLSRTLDSGEEETVWHRLTADAEIGENMAVFYYLYATDSKSEVEKIEERWKSGDITVRRQVEQMKPQMELRNPKDVLIHKVKGRFLWVGILMWGNRGSGPKISGIQIYFPRETWNACLPEIYQGEKQEFLARFLGIFQSMYSDMDKQIINDAAYLDIQAADAEILSWLSGWIHVDNSHLWPVKQLKQYLDQGAALFSVRGTAGALIRMVEIYTGEKCFLAEDPGIHRVTLLIKEQAIGSQREFRAVERIIREGKPADVELCLIPLKPYLFLNRHTYLGINSMLNDYGPAVLGRDAALSFVKLGGNAYEESDVHAIC